MSFKIALTTTLFFLFLLFNNLTSIYATIHNSPPIKLENVAMSPASYAQLFGSQSPHSDFMDKYRALAFSLEPFLDGIGQEHLGEEVEKCIGQLKASLAGMKAFGEDFWRHFHLNEGVEGIMAKFGLIKFDCAREEPMKELREKHEAIFKQISETIEYLKGLKVDLEAKKEAEIIEIGRKSEQRHKNVGIRMRNIVKSGMDNVMYSMVDKLNKIKLINGMAKDEEEEEQKGHGSNKFDYPHPLALAGNYHFA